MSEDKLHIRITLELKNDALTMNLIKLMVTREDNTDNAKSRAKTSLVLIYWVVNFVRCWFKVFKISIIVSGL